MTLIRPSLFLNRLVIAGAGRVVYDEKFKRGVNIIRGSNSSGKSTICDFIFFVLGGEVKEWKPEAERCDYVMAEIAVNNQPLTLRRQVTISARQLINIFWGPYEVARVSAIEGWQTYSFQRSTQKESFSQAMFRALGLPEVKGDLQSNITMHQILRLLYVDQLSPVDALMRHEEFDPPLTRTTVGDMLLGVYDDALYTDELKHREVERALQDATRHVESLIQVLGAVEKELDLQKIEDRIIQTEEQYNRLVQAIVAAKQTEAIEPLTPNAPTLEQLRAEVVRQRELWIETKTDVQRQQFEVEDSRQFIDSLERRLVALQDSVSARNFVGEIPLTHCPECLSPLLPPDEEGRCILCRQPLPKDETRSQILRMRQELAVQIKESRILLEKKENRLTELKRALPQLEVQLRIAETRLTEAATRVRTRRDENIDALLEKKGFFESQLQGLHEQARILAVLQDEKNRKARLTSQLQDLSIAIKTRRKQQEGRLAQGRDRIQGYALALLKRDLPREPYFSVAQSVTVNFAKNTFAVDGRNQFSAS
jgi:hypothetical protein